MNLKFWKKQPTDLNRVSEINPSLFLQDFVLQDLDESSPFLEGKLNYPNIQYQLVELNTVFNRPTAPLLELKSLFDNDLINSSQSETQEQFILVKNFKKQIEIIIKDKTLKKLNDTIMNLHEECKEEGFQKFSEIARKNAKQILRFIYSEFPKYEYYIYPTEDREIAIDCNPQKGKGILVLCDSNGGVACFATFEGKNRRFRYNSIDDFSYRLLRETFEELDIEKKHLSASPSSGNSFSILKPTELNYNLPKNGTYR